MPQALLFDHDGGVDDLLSLMLVLTMNHIDLKGVSITPADCIGDYAEESTRKLLQLFSQPGVPVARGNYHGINAFPLEWRAGPMVVNALPLMINVEVAKPTEILESVELLAEELKKVADSIPVLMTGPCSNLVRTLQRYPELSAKVKEVIWMGGAVDTGGNVVTYNHNSSAEWNVFWDPIGSKTLFELGIPITLFPLDVTNSVPVNYSFLKDLARIAEYDAANLAGQFWATTLNTIPAYEYTYYMWDILATSYLGIPDAFEFEEIPLTVATQAPNAGQTIRLKAGAHKAKVAMKVDKNYFYQYLLQQFSINF
ncbi:MAG: nucleoside hydrolase [Saprospiraceae bacterium]|nr:nucleoside hydrolase [Saprospiraceae bacterium]